MSQAGGTGSLRRLRGMLALIKHRRFWYWLTDPPGPPKVRITDALDVRITEAGDRRITES